MIFFTVRLTVCMLVFESKIFLLKKKLLFMHVSVKGDVKIFIARVNTDLFSV